MAPRVSALVLAGRRGGGHDPELARTGHRALFEVGGVPMLVRVVQALRASPAVGRITVSSDDPAAFSGIPELADVEVHRSLDSPSRSVADVLAELPSGEPLLATTADHALLTPAMLDHLVAATFASDADLVVGTVTASALRARYPESTRTLIRLRGESYAGANLFVFKTPRSHAAADFWVRAERFRKRPWRLVSVFGPGALALFLLRRLDLEAALARVSNAVGCRVAAVCLPHPEAAIDVDRPDDAALAERILAERERT